MSFYSDPKLLFAGWVAVGWWLAHGMTYADIARIPESEAPGRVAKALDALVTGQR